VLRIISWPAGISGIAVPQNGALFRDVSAPGESYGLSPSPWTIEPEKVGSRPPSYLAQLFFLEASRIGWPLILFFPNPISLPILADHVSKGHAIAVTLFFYLKYCL